VHEFAPAPVLEDAAQSFVQATAHPPFLFELGPREGRRAVDEAQAGDVPRPEARIEDVEVPGGPSGTVSVRILRPVGATGVLPVIVYVHGAGWVFGNSHTHDRLVREIVSGTGAAVVFPNYSLSPEARYPTAIEEIYAVLEWVARSGSEHELDGARVTIAGDSVGGNMTAAVTLLAKARSGPRLGAQVLFYPVTDAAFETQSYQQFAEGYFLRRDAMVWFWDQYTTDPIERQQITASPLRATPEQLQGLPRALVITAEADVLRDEGEAYSRKLREAGVDVVATRYGGAIHDFVMLNSLRGTSAAQAAISQAVEFLGTALAEA
jgi:acetyl esterase